MRKGLKSDFITSLTREELYYRHQLSHQQIDDILRENISMEYPESKAQHLGKLRAFHEISDLLGRSSVEFIPLKGPLLSFRLYGDPLYRSYNDLDFFIDASLVPLVVNLLTNEGYLSPFYKFPESECRRKLLFNHINEIYLFNPKLETGIEIHWNLFTIKTLSSERINSLIQGNLTSIRFDNLDYSVFNNEFELLFLVIHGGLHGWNKLKWSYDIKVMLNKYPVNVSLFLNLTRKLKCGRLVSVCNELIKHFFPETKLLPEETTAPPKMVRYALSQITSADEKKTPGWFVKVYFNRWNAFPGVINVAATFQQMLFATDLASAKWIPCWSVSHYIAGPVWKLLRGFR